MITRTDWRRIGIGLAGLAAVLWIGYQLRAVLNPLLLAALVAYILNPAVNWMERKGISRFRAILALYGIGAFLVAAALLFAVPPLYRQSVRSAEQLREYIEDQPDGIEQIVERLDKRVRQVPLYDDAVKLLEIFLSEPKRREDIQARLMRAVSWFGERATAPIGKAFSFLSYLVLVPIYAFYFLQKIPALYATIPTLIPPGIRPKTLAILQRIDVAMAGFVFGRSLVCILKGLVIFVGLWLLSVPYAFVMGILCAILSLLPAASLVGGGGIALLLASSQGASTAIVVGVVVVFALSEVVEGILSPVILGRTASLHPVMIVFAMIAFGKLLGLFGVLLAVPLASATKILWTDLVRPYITSAWGEPRTG